MEEMTCMIQCENITKKYALYSRKVDRLLEAMRPGGRSYHKDFYALQGITFSMHKGECVGIVGKNGSGKSTLLKILTGVLTPTEGSVHVQGRVSALLELGAGFNPEYTGYENIYLNGSIMGYSREEMQRKLPEIIEFADIGDFINQPVKIYSSGMFVRLAFAVAISVDPEILIIDEALAVGDVFFQLKCYKKIEDFKKQGKTILFVSHDQSSIIKYCDRAILLDKGRMVCDGAPKEVFQDVEGLKAVGLTVPQTTELLWQLRQEGRPLSVAGLSGELSSEEMSHLTGVLQKPVKSKTAIGRATGILSAGASGIWCPLRKRASTMKNTASGSMKICPSCPSRGSSLSRTKRNSSLKSSVPCSTARMWTV